MPELKWRLTSSLPKSLDTLFGGAESFAKKLAAFPTAVLEACFNATNELCNEIVAKNPKFKKG